MDSKGVRRLYLLLRPKGRFSPGRKTPPDVSAPSTGLRPLDQKMMPPVLPAASFFYSLFVPVVVSCLDIVIVIQEIQNPVHLFDGVVVR